jgi:protein involved in polysaccharide export with SLBB domain
MRSRSHSVDQPRRTPSGTLASLLRRGLAAVLVLFVVLGSTLGTAGCVGVEDKRIRDLLVTKGFGSRSQGDATVENYVVGGDAIAFLIDPAVLVDPTAAQLALLASPQPVGLDGKIFIPTVGQVYVLGATEEELSRLVSEELQARFAFEVRVTARILSTGKVLYAFGELLQTGRIPLPEAEFTILDFVGINRPTPLANYGRVRIIRPDAENPLVLYVNVREMIQTGRTRYNVLLRDNDIIYVPPTFFGLIARFLQRLLQPLALVVQAVFGVFSVQTGIAFITGMRSRASGSAASRASDPAHTVSCSNLRTTRRSTCRSSRSGATCRC